MSETRGGHLLGHNGFSVTISEGEVVLEEGRELNRDNPTIDTRRGGSLLTGT